MKTHAEIEAAIAEHVYGEQKARNAQFDEKDPDRRLALIERECLEFRIASALRWVLNEEPISIGEHVTLRGDLSEEGADVVGVHCNEIWIKWRGGGGYSSRHKGDVVRWPAKP